jgi:hypothetical protein
MGYQSIVQFGLSFKQFGLSLLLEKSVSIEYQYTLSIQFLFIHAWMHFNRKDI